MDDQPNLGTLFGAGKTDTFLGLAACDDLDALDASSAFLGVPAATPYASVGAYARNGPASLRQAIGALAANIERHNFDLGGPTFPAGVKPGVDCGDLNWSQTDFEANRALILESVARIMARGAVPIVVGGDDSVPIPMLQALAETGHRYTILQIDAHIDWRDTHMDERLGLSSTMRRASEMTHIERIVQVGARGIGSGHSSNLAAARDWGVEFFFAREIARHGIAPVLQALPEGARIVVCFDIDALDPSCAPNTIGRTPGGLSYFQALDLISGAATRGIVDAVDFVEILPEADIDGLGGLTVSRLVAATMGLIARQRAGLPLDTQMCSAMASM